jgi:hypothetical protein
MVTKVIDKGTALRLLNTVPSGALCHEQQTQADFSPLHLAELALRALSLSP